MNKNFIFLICNGILVFLAKTSAFVRPSSPSDLEHALHKRIGNALEEETEAEETLSDKHINLGDEETINPYEGEHVDGELDEIELRDCCLFEDVDDQDQEVCNGGEEVDEIEKLSNDELNQKFEDFIRRMKEEFQINDYQRKQLVLVN
ncbi:hypothetical protein SASPL_114270 [Salvia splendens]|uniref:Uncharacterized protein n=1 Tax=Salvia splendens TaxID=180675 RepID=A0A8X8Y1J4_SALSN|nr:uncharacterized protein LOC121803804 [Salvia splendens]KAG6423865.1 hypothetical protein SASPL_114270 [Salvia splendens]